MLTMHAQQVWRRRLAEARSQQQRNSSSAPLKMHTFDFPSGALQMDGGSGVVLSGSDAILNGNGVGDGGGGDRGSGAAARSRTS